MKEYYQSNQKLWNDKIDYHAKSDFYRLDDFKKGWNSLKSIELEALGDVNGKSLLHLQCHFGQDTLSWARLGAKVTGVDFASKAINLANKLATEIGEEATFVESNIMNLEENLAGEFDIVFTSYGTIGWLHDLDKWAENIKRYLKPNGTFLIADFHPYFYMYDGETGEMKYPYFHEKEPDFDIADGTYADNDAPIGGKEYFWAHPISDIISKLLKQGLTLELFEEYDYSPYDCFPNLTKTEEGKYVYQETKAILPHVFCMKFKN